MPVALTGTDQCSDNPGNFILLSDYTLPPGAEYTMGAGYALMLMGDTYSYGCLIKSHLTSKRILFSFHQFINNENHEAQFDF